MSTETNKETTEAVKEEAPIVVDELALLRQEVANLKAEREAEKKAELAEKAAELAAQKEAELIKPDSEILKEAEAKGGLIAEASITITADQKKAKLMDKKNKDNKNYKPCCPGKIDVIRPDGRRDKPAFVVQH